MSYIILRFITPIQGRSASTKLGTKKNIHSFPQFILQTSSSTDHHIFTTLTLYSMSQMSLLYPQYQTSIHLIFYIYPQIFQHPILLTFIHPSNLQNFTSFTFISTSLTLCIPCIILQLCHSTFCKDLAFVHSHNFLLSLLFPSSQFLFDK